MHSTVQQETRQCKPSRTKVKEKEEKKKEKTAVMAAADATEEAVESDSGAAEAVVVRDDKLRDLEVLTIGSDPISTKSQRQKTKRRQQMQQEVQGSVH